MSSTTPLTNSNDSNESSTTSLPKSRSLSHVINMNEEEYVHSSSSPPLRINISRSSSGSQVKIPTPLTQIAYEAISIDGSDEEDITIKGKKSKKKDKSKKNKSLNEEKENKNRNSLGVDDGIINSDYYCESPSKFREDIDSEFTELNDKNHSVDDTMDISNTPSSSIQSFYNVKSSNPNLPSKSKRHKSNTSSKGKLNTTSRSSSSKGIPSMKQKKNKNRISSKIAKQKTQTFSLTDDYINEVKGLSSEEALNRLLLEEDRIIDNERTKKKIFKNKTFIIITLLQLVTIIVFIFLFITATAYQKSVHRSIEYLIELILLILWMFLNIIIVKHETEAYSSELTNKARYVFNKIRTSGINMIQVII
ncbi:hypothetical protein PIROE2DRAFT_9387 [Piromyces sp. E2]|nr:hypothetical protein PIROE2DRAFT_9387 [Piromyces sp. E2]|eukprot:OUM63999.1 hypothetical protein PIROE2DRAFT_9387 [Piromyces sp. E2]